MNAFEDRSDRAKWLVLLALVVVAVFGVRTISSGDVWMHLALGRQVAEQGIPRTDALSFTAAGRAWADSSWLYDRLLFALWNAGKAPAVILVHAALLTVAFLLLVPVARKWAGDTSIALALLAAAWLVAPRFVVGPELVGLLFTALFLAVLSAGWYPWAAWVVLLPAQVAWANLHGSFPLGFALCAVFAVEAWVRGRNAPAGASWAPAAALAGAAALATLVNPYGLKLHAHVLAASSGVASNFVQEWISPFSMQFTPARYAKHLVTLALLIGAGGLVAERRRLPVALTTLAVFGAFLIVRSLRHVGIFAILSLPFIALSLEAIGGALGAGLGRLLKARPDAPPPGARAAAGVAAVLALLSLGLVCSNLYYVSTGSVSTFGLGVEYDLFPQAAAEVIRRPDFPERAVNLAFDGGFLAWARPERKVFVDSRAVLYGAEFYATLADGLAGKEEAWKKIEDAWQPGAVILNCCVQGSGAAVREMLKTGLWALAYFDGTTAILLKTVSDNRVLIQDRGIQAAGLQVLEQERKRYAARLGSVGVPGIPARLVGASAFYLALGRFREAQAVSALVTGGAPMSANAWFSLGVSSAQLGESERAIGALQTACRLMPKNIYTWLYLSRALADAGRTDEAQSAVARASAMDPLITSAFVNPEGAGKIEPTR